MKRDPPPPSSPTMVGNAVDTTVWSSAATRIPSMTVTKIRLIARLVSSCGWVGGAVVVVTG